MKNMPYLQNQIPQPISHVNQSYSLENDMILGWVPSYIQEEPMKIMYVNELNDEVIKYYQENNPEKIVYLGSRPTNTCQFHQQLQSQYKYYKSRFEKVAKMPQSFVGMNPQFKQPLQFNSIFEGGNLDLAIQKSLTEFDLFIRVDTNTQGHNMWYYFEMTGFKNYEQITLNICNFRKKRCLYERGMKPFVCRQSQNWQQEGEKMKYIPYKSQFSTNKQYYCLSFTLLNIQKDDSIKVAYCIPYTFTQLQNFLKEIDSKYLEQSSLCCSLSGVAIPKLTLSKGSIMNKKVIVIQARIHPGESNSSWVMQGLLKYLTSEEAEKLLDILIFVIIPMLNVDGVIFGNYRTGCAGRDLNRKFREPCKSLFPAVVAMKNLVSELHSVYGEQLMGFFDLHGHSAKKNTFLYGPEFPIWNSNYYKSRLFAKILSKKTPVFRYFSCLFRINKCKTNTARAVFCELYDFVNCFTIEVSNSSYYLEQNTFFFSNDHWLQLGNIIGESFYDFLETSQEIDTIFYDVKDKKMSSSTKNKLNNQEKEQKLKKICQNSKYSTLFQEMQDETPNLSFSEGGSDSENDSDDLNDQQLQPVFLLKQTPKNKKNNLKVSLDFPKIKRKQQNITPQTVQQYIEQQSNHVFQQPNNQTVYRKSGYKTATKFREKKSQTQQRNYTEEMKNLTTYRATFQGSKQIKLEDIGHFSSNNMSPLKVQTIIENQAKSHQAQIDEQTVEEIFQPYKKKNSIEKKIENNKNNVVILHTPLHFDQRKSFINPPKHFQTEQDSYSNVVQTIYHGLNHDIPQTKYRKQKTYQRSRNPTLALKNTLQIQKIGQTEESQGMIIKPRLFSSPQIEEQISIMAKLNSVTQKNKTSSTKKDQKQSVPASFYQMKKHWTNARTNQQFVK